MIRKFQVFCILWFAAYHFVYGQDWEALTQEANSIVNSDPDSAYLLFKDVIANSRDSTLIIESYMGIGTAFQYKSEYDTAVNMYFKALTLAEGMNLGSQIASIKNRLGTLYLGISDLTKAKKYLEEAISFFSVANDTISLTQATMNLAGVYFMSGDVKTCIDKLKFATVLAKASQNYRTEGAIYSNLSMVYQNLGKMDSAIWSVNQGIRILDELNDLRGKMLSLKQKALLLESSEQVEAAKEVWSSLFEVAKAIGNKEGIYDYYLNRSRLAKKTNNKDLAYDLIFEALQWRDSTLLRENLELLNEMNAKYESAKKEAQVAKLENENTIRTNQRNLFLIIGLSTTCLLVFVIFIYSQKQKINTQLQEKNQLIKEALDQKQMLIKEIYHRVKNNLQIVSSLLNTQEKLILDAPSKAVIKETKSRVISMALVHENLQEVDEGTSVNISEYLEDLLDSLQDTFNNAINPVHFEIELQVKEVPASIAVHLGLIVNEAVTNAFKYAFLGEVINPFIQVILGNDQEGVKLVVKDNGVGMDDSRKGSYGIKLMRNLAETKQGSLEILNSEGTTINVSIPFDHD